MRQRGKSLTGYRWSRVDSDDVDMSEEANTLFLISEEASGDAGKFWNESASERKLLKITERI